MHRAYHALPPFTAKDGTPTNAVYGFFAMLHKAISDFNPNYVVVGFDTRETTFRRKMLKQYQAHRPKTAPDLATQMSIIQGLLVQAGISTFSKGGYEADDILGTVAAHYKNNSIRVFILSGDKDILQLVDKNVFVIAPKTGISAINIYDEKGVIERVGVEPAKIPDLKALTGDSSDNYSGAKGIGPKTAIKLLEQFGSVENLFKNIDKIDDERMKKLLKEQQENILLGKKLSAIVQDLDLDISLERAKFEGFKPEMKESLEKLDLFTLATRLFRPKAAARPDESKAEKQKESPDQTSLF